MDCLWDVRGRVKDVTKLLGRCKWKYGDTIYIDEKNFKTTHLV